MNRPAHEKPHAPRNLSGRISRSSTFPHIELFGDGRVEFENRMRFPIQTYHKTRKTAQGFGQKAGGGTFLFKRAYSVASARTFRGPSPPWPGLENHRRRSPRTPAGGAPAGAG